jgi:hypothetical protein
MPIISTEDPMPKQFEVDLDKLEYGLPTLSAREGAFLMETAIFCLDKNSHSSGVLVRNICDNCPEFQII